MSKKLMTLKDLQNREDQKNKEEQLKRLESGDDSQPIDIDVIYKATTSKTKSRTRSSRPLGNVLTLADLEKEKPNEEEVMAEVQKTVTRRVTLSSVIKLMIPISIAMFLVILYVKLICMENCKNEKQNPNPFNVKQKTIGLSIASNSLLGNLITSGIMITSIVVLSVILVLLFYYKLDKIAIGIIGLSIGFVVTVSAFFNLREILIEFNIPFDIITRSLFLWNYAVSAMIAIFWKSPLIVNQAFLINVTVLLSIGLLRVLPGFTTWALLGILVIWDLIAVLTPYGPLRILISIFEKRKKQNKDFEIPPGLLYSTIVWFAADKEEDGEESGQPKQIMIYTGPKLGLGDFVFYSLLMGKAAVYGDLNLILGCYLAIIVGFMLTLLLVAVFQMPLPALPISITFGIIIFVITYFCVNPFLNELSFNLIYL